MQKTVLASSLLGAHTVMVGISPEVAQTIVELGLNLNTVTTRSSLESGIAYAFHRS